MKKILLTLTLLILSVSTSFAEPMVEKVGKFIEEVGNGIVKIANQKISEQDKKTKIISIIDDNVDSKWIARFVLSKNYRRANLEQKKRFTDLYREFMINTYGPKFKNYDGRKFTVNKITKQKSFYLVKAEFLPRESNVPISIDFRVKEKSGKLVILDFIAEGISLIATQRSEFNSAISRDGMVKFLDILEKRVDKLKAENS
jgi:phospholipid transport system substrate-binding protein